MRRYRATSSRAISTLITQRWTLLFRSNWRKEPRTVFAFFLPNIEVPTDEAPDFTAVGIHQEHVKRGGRPYRSDTWHPFVMRGTARNVIVGYKLALPGMYSSY